jgi:hypothetical protein
MARTHQGRYLCTNIYLVTHRAMGKINGKSILISFLMSSCSTNKGHILCTLVLSPVRFIKLAKKVWIQGKIQKGNTPR